MAKLNNKRPAKKASAVKSSTKKAAAVHSSGKHSSGKPSASSKPTLRTPIPLPPVRVPAASISVKPRLKPVRRVVTGNDEHGKSIFIFDHNAPHRQALRGIANFGMTDLWKTFGAPADNRGNEDAVRGTIALEPPPLGSILRVVEFPPDKEIAQKDGGKGERAPAFHRSNTIDYIIVLEGEIFAILEKDEVKLKAGDILVQRGTSHAWANRSNKPCIVAAVLINAKPAYGGSH